MNTGYYQATGGMVTQMNRLNTITNNLANLNTNGYKKEDVVIGDFMAHFKEARENLPLANNTYEGSQFLNRTIDRVPQVVEGYKDFTMGVLKSTGNPLDFSLKNAKLFFKIQTENGSRLTQDGSFSLDENGVLVTKSGDKVLDDKDKEITLRKDQLISSNQDGSLFSNNTKIAKIAIVQVDELKALKQVENNLFELKDMSELKLVEKGDYLMQGYIQKSNVNPVNEMVSLIETNRLVSMYQKVMTTHMNDLNNDAINKLGNVRA